MITTADENVITVPPADSEIEAMMKAGVHLGHARSKRHPAMLSFIWGVRNNVEIIDLTKTREKLDEALAFLRQSAREKKLILFVATRPSAKELTRKTADAIGYPSCGERWIGGTLTNFKVILKRIETLEELERQKSSGEFEKYTKKEQLVRTEEIGRLARNFDGLRRLKKLPDVLVVIDPAYDDLAPREAKRMGIPVVALVDTNSDPRAVEYPILSNNDARSAVAYMLERMRQAIGEGQGEGQKEAESAAVSSAEGVGAGNGQANND